MDSGHGPTTLSLLDTCFGELSIRDCQELSFISKTVDFPAGAILLREGEVAAGVYVLLSGRVKHSVASQKGDSQIMHAAGPGEVVGLTSVISGKACELRVECLVASSFLFFPVDSFLAFLRTHTDVCMNIVKLLSMEVDWAGERIRSLRGRS